MSFCLTFVADMTGAKNVQSPVTVSHLNWFFSEYVRQNKIHLEFQDF